MSKIKSYYCPHCKKFLIDGDVKKLNMPCPYCQKMINADEVDLLGTGYIKKNKMKDKLSAMSQVQQTIKMIEKD